MYELGLARMERTGGRMGGCQWVGGGWEPSWHDKPLGKDEKGRTSQGDGEVDGEEENEEESRDEEKEVIRE